MNFVKDYLNVNILKFTFVTGSTLAILSIFVGWLWILMAIWLLAFIAIGYHEDENKLRGAINSVIGQVIGLFVIIFLSSPLLDTTDSILATATAFIASGTVMVLLETVSRINRVSKTIN